LKVGRKEERDAPASAAGEPAPVAALPHVGPLGTIRQHLAKLCAAQAIPASAGQAFVLDNGRLVRLGVGGLDDEPVVCRLAWPIGGLRLVAVATGEQPGRDFSGRRKRKVRSCHKYVAFCRYGVTLRRWGGISSFNFERNGLLLALSDADVWWISRSSSEGERPGFQHGDGSEPGLRNNCR